MLGDRYCIGASQEILVSTTRPVCSVSRPLKILLNKQCRDTVDCPTYRYCTGTVCEAMHSCILRLSFHVVCCRIVRESLVVVFVS